MLVLDLLVCRPHLRLLRECDMFMLKVWCYCHRLPCGVASELLFCFNITVSKNFQCEFKKFDCGLFRQFGIGSARNVFYLQRI